MFIFALFLSLFAAPAFAQEQTLEEMMAEVEAEEESNEADAGDAEDDQESDEGVKSLEQLMGEVDEFDELDVDAEPATTTGATATVDTEAVDEVEAEEPGAPTWFWLGLFGILFGLILLGVPLYVLIGSLTLYLLLAGGVFTEFRLLTSVIEQTRGLADQPVLLAIPFFVISGAIMTEGDIAQRLIDFAQSVFGWLPGGLAISAVFACVFFAAISGSSPVTVIAIGTIMYPALMASNYPDRFSTGLVTSAGSLGILIPPSIPMIVYAIVDPTGLKDPIGYALASAGGGDSSVKDLFIAGLGPGLLIGLVFSVYALRVGLKHKVDRTPFAFAQVFESGKRGIWALLLPVIILGGIYSGIFTPTQAAAVAVIYSAAVEFFIHRSLEIKDIPRVFNESAILMGALLIIMALALGFNLYLDRAKIPEAAVEMILEMNLSVFTFLIIVNILLLIVGFFMDILSAILILVPLLAPIAFGLGIHPLHMAVIFIVNLEIGYLTPPIGLNLFVASTLFKKGIGEVVRAVIPFMLLMVGCLIAITYVPAFSLGLVALSKGKSPWVGWPDREAIEKKVDDVPGARTTTEPEPDQPEPAEGVKSLEELMNETDGEGGDEGVKSLDELMNETYEEGEEEEGPPDDGKVKTLEELMEEAEEE